MGLTSKYKTQSCFCICCTHGPRVILFVVYPCFECDLSHEAWCRILDLVTRMFNLL